MTEATTLTSMAFMQGLRHRDGAVVRHDIVAQRVEVRRRIAEPEQVQTMADRVEVRRVAECRVGIIWRIGYAIASRATAAEPG